MVLDKHAKVTDKPNTPSLPATANAKQPTKWHRQSQNTEKTKGGGTVYVVAVHNPRNVRLGTLDRVVAVIKHIHEH